SDSDDDADLMIFESLIPIRDIKQAGTIKVTFDGLLKEPLVLQEDLKEGCGGQLWPAGMLLARYMLQEHRTDLVDKTIVELGAGGGLVGLAVAQGCNTNMPIYITDQVPMLSLMQANIAINRLTSKVSAAVLDWASPPSTDLPQYPAVVLAADCVYFEPAFPLLISTLERLLGPESVCYFSFKRRRRADVRCIKAIKKKFAVVEIHQYPGCHDYSRENLFLYQIQARSQ
ncbi:putative methyltransferase-domain-containing protein, partial [Talaromyces proteolyticus]